MLEKNVTERNGPISDNTLCILKEYFQAEFPDEYIELMRYSDGMRINDDIVDKFLTWLQVIPITEAEYEYAEENGSDALENLLEQKNTDVLNLHRESIL